MPLFTSKNLRGKNQLLVHCVGEGSLGTAGIGIIPQGALRGSAIPPSRSVSYALEDRCLKYKHHLCDK